MEKVMRNTRHDPSHEPNPSHWAFTVFIRSAQTDAGVDGAVTAMLLCVAPIPEPRAEQRLRDSVLPGAFGPRTVGLIKRAGLGTGAVGHHAALLDETAELVVLGTPIVICGADLGRLLQTHAPP